jgi:hypothetical protein
VVRLLEDVARGAKVSSHGGMPSVVSLSSLALAKPGSRTEALQAVNSLLRENGGPNLGHLLAQQIPKDGPDALKQRERAESVLLGTLISLPPAEREAVMQEQNRLRIICKNAIFGSLVSKNDRICAICTSNVQKSPSYQGMSALPQEMQAVAKQGAQRLEMLMARAPGLNEAQKEAIRSKAMNFFKETTCKDAVMSFPLPSASRPTDPARARLGEEWTDMRHFGYLLKLLGKEIYDQFDIPDQLYMQRRADGMADGGMTLRRWLERGPGEGEAFGILTDVAGAPGEENALNIPADAAGAPLPAPVGPPPPPPPAAEPPLPGGAAATAPPTDTPALAGDLAAALTAAKGRLKRVDLPVVGGQLHQPQLNPAAAKVRDGINTFYRQLSQGANAAPATDAVIAHRETRDALSQLLQFAEGFSLEGCPPGEGGVFTETQGDLFRLQAGCLQGLLENVRGRVPYCDEGSGEAQLMREVLRHVQGSLAPLLKQVAELKGSDGEGKVAANARAVQQQGQGLAKAMDTCTGSIDTFISKEAAAKARAEKAVGLLNRAQHDLEGGNIEDGKRRIIEDIKNAIEADEELAAVLDQLDSTLNPSILERLGALDEDFKNFMQGQLESQRRFADDPNRARNRDAEELRRLEEEGHAFH